MFFCFDWNQFDVFADTETQTRGKAPSREGKLKIISNSEINGHVNLHAAFPALSHA